jgi:hypothetical protein
MNPSLLEGASPDPAMGAFYIIGGLAAAGFALVIWRGRPDSCGGLYRRHPVLFLPPLLLLNVLWVLGGLPAFQRMLVGDAHSHVLPGLTLQPNGLLLASLVLTPAAVTAQVLLTHAAAEGRLTSWAEALGGYWHKLPAFIGAWMVCTWLPVLVFVPLSMAPRDALVPLLFAGAVGGVVANVLTCTWYAAMAEERSGWLPGLAAAVRFGMRRWKPLLKIVLLQLVLSGYFVYYDVTVRPPPPKASLPSPPPLSASRSFSFGGTGGWTERSGTAITLMSVLTMDEDNRWFTKLRDASGAETWPTSKYLVQTITILVAAFFVSRYSLAYLCSPTPQGRAPGFEVVARPVVPVETLDAPPPERL